MKNRFLLLCVLTFFGFVNALAQPANFYPRGVGGGGALFFPKINPANDNEFYIACDMSEMFHSADYGKSYSQLHFSRLQALNVSTYEFTNDPNTAYSNFNDGNDGYPVKTADGGATWTMLPGYDAGEGQIFSMKANYTNPGQVLLDYYDKIVISNDGGTTFTTIATATDEGSGLIMGGVYFDPGGSIYIGTNQGVYIYNGTSTSIMSTTGIAEGELIWQFAGAKSGTTTRFVCITAASADVYNGLMPYDYYGLAKNVYTMDNESGTWVSKTGSIDVSSDFVMYIGMAGNNVDTFYLAGNDGALDAPLIYKTTDGGGSWNKVFQSTNNVNVKTGWSGDGGDKGWSWGESAFGIAVSPVNADKALFGDYSFVHVTSDGGASWEQAYVRTADEHPADALTPKHDAYHSIGLENTSCWQVDWQSPSAMLAGFSDIGAIRSADSGNSWSFNYTGMSVNSLYRIAKTPGGTLFAATSGVHDMYQSTRLKDAQLDAADGSGNINYSTDGGATWNALHSFGHPVFWVAIDPNDSNKMYASVIDYSGGQGGIWMTSDLHDLAGSSWTQLTAPPRTEGHPACIAVLNDGKVLCTFSGHIASGGSFTASSGVFLYDPSTSSWSDASDPNMYYWTKDIIVDPSDATQNTWFACVFTHWGGTSDSQGGLYKTTNRGASWTKLTGTMFDRVTSITFNPLNTNQVFLTTETQGLWICSDIHAATTTWSLVGSYPFRQPERVYFNPYNQSEMWVTSFGNGLKVGNTNDTSTLIPAIIAGQPGLKVFPNPVSEELQVEISGSTGHTVDVYDLTGKLVTKIFPASRDSFRINTSSWISGIYIICYAGNCAKVVKE